MLSLLICLPGGGFFFVDMPVVFVPVVERGEKIDLVATRVECV